MSKKSKKSSDNYLDKIPVFNEKYSWKADESGIVTIYIENKGFFNFICQKLFKKPKVSQVHLEEMGSFIIPLLDGKRTVYDLALLIKEHFGEKAEPVYNRLVTYMHTLEAYSFIYMKH
jgi:hypothetical protein